MKYAIVCMILLLLFGCANGLTGKKIQTDLSASGKILVEHYFTSPDELRQIFLRDKAGDSAPIPLATYNRSAGVLFSPDEKWLTVNDHAGSNISEIRVFRQTQGLHYKEATDSHLHEKVWKLFHLRQHDLELDFLHTYTVAICWGPDSDSPLVEIHAAAILLKDKSVVVHIGPWHCVYSIAKSVATDEPETLRQFESGVRCK